MIIDDYTELHPKIFVFTSLECRINCAIFTKILKSNIFVVLRTSMKVVSNVSDITGMQQVAHIDLLHLLCFAVSKWTILSSSS